MSGIRRRHGPSRTPHRRSSAHGTKHDDRGRICRACRRRRRLYVDQRPALSRIDRLPDARFQRAEHAGHRPVRRARTVRRRGALLARRVRAALGQPHADGRHVRDALQRPSVDRSHLCDWERPAMFPQTDKYTDVGFDSAISVSGRQLLADLARQLHREYQQLDASFANFERLQSKQLPQLAPFAGFARLWRRSSFRFHRTIFRCLGHLRPVALRRVLPAA